MPWGICSSYLNITAGGKLIVDQMEAKRSQMYSSRIAVAVTCCPRSSAGVLHPGKGVSSEFGCLGRVTRLGVMLLPQQINAAGQPLLTSPVYLSAGSSTALEDMTGQAVSTYRHGHSSHRKTVRSAHQVMEGEGPSHREKTTSPDGSGMESLTLSGSKPA